MQLPSLTALSVAATLALASNAASADPLPLRVGYFSQLHDAAVLDLANQLPKEQYDVSYVRFQRYADAAIALSRGDIDASSLGYANLITEAAKDTEPKFRFVSGLARGAINLVCNKKVSIEQWSDLKGKSVGIVAGFPEIFLDDALKVHGQNSRDLRKVNFAVAGPPVLQALKDGTTDCAAVFEPFGATAVSAGYAYYPKTQIWVNSFKGLNNGLALSTAFDSKHPQAAADLRAAVAKSTQAFRERPGQWSAFMRESQGIALEIVHIGIERVTLDPALYPQEAGVLASNMHALGLIRKQPSPEQLGKFFRTN